MFQSYFLIKIQFIYMLGEQYSLYKAIHTDPPIALEGKGHRMGY